MSGGRPKNTVNTFSLNVSTNALIGEYLDKMVLSGHWGKNRSEAAERLLVLAVQHLKTEGAFKLKKIEED